MLVGGDEKKAKAFLGPARSQMEILKNQMSFQNLSQGIRRLWLNNNVYVECRKIFDYQECRVWVRPELEKPEEQTVRYFLVVFASGSGNEAVVWDLVSNTVFMTVDTLTEITTKFADLGLPTLTEAVCPATDSHEWEAYPPPQVHDSPLMLPNYIVGFFEIPEYEDMITSVHSWKYPAEFSYPGGFQEVLNWDLDYIDESPLPYPNKSVISTTSPNDEDEEKASYISVFWSSADDGYPSYADTTNYSTIFENLTGCDFPSGLSIQRYLQYWHPFFWYSNKDIDGTLSNLSADGRGILLADSWEDGEWTCSPLTLDKSSLIWQTSGIATITENTEEELLDDPQVLLFEYVSVCHKFVDTFGSGMCDKDLSEFEEHFRIYEHGKIELTGLVKEILDLTNAERVGQGTHELVFNSVLSEAAQRHAEDQAALVASSGVEGITDGHTGTDGSSPMDRITDAGYFTWIDTDIWGYKISENVAWTYDSSPAARAIQLWKASTTGHWENMIDEDLSELGVGVAGLPDGGYIFVQNFGKVDHRYPGFSPFDTTELKNYIDTNFIFDPVNEDTRVPKMYLLGSVELNNNQFYRLTGRRQD